MANIENGNYVHIAGENYPINPVGTHWSIGKISHSLITDIEVTAPDMQRDIEKGLLDEYKDDGRIKFSLEAIGIFNHGIPTGRFHYKEDKNDETYTYVRKEGLDYRLDFFGMVTYENSWVRLDGELRPPYDPSPVFPIKAAVNLDPKALDWSEYRFKSLHETAGADKKQVCHLEITNPEFTELPPEIYDFINLEHLALVNKRDYWDNTKLPLAKLDDRLGELVRLKGINVNKAAISSLPATIGALQQLEVLNLSLCELTEVPDAVWQLPRLTYLILMGNRISFISEYINLPALQTLNVERNALKTLPEALLTQPKLKTVKATGNPFAFLPDRFSFFSGLDLSMKEKKKLLDNTYKGADGKGTVKWDDRPYFAARDGELIAPVHDIIKQYGLAEYQKPLISLVKKAVGFNLTDEEDYAAVGNHRFGGRPDLPIDVAYPSFFDNEEKRELCYEFIAQLNCEQLGELQDYLPRTGSLFFFFKSIHYFGLAENEIARVIYVQDNGLLASGKRFLLSDADFLELPDGQYTPYKADAFAMAAAPSFYAAYQNDYLFAGKSKPLKDNGGLLEDLHERFEEPVNTLRRFDHAVNAYGFTQHESPELQAALKLKGNPQDWVILLRVASAGDFQWGDAGDLFFVIHKSDLAKGAFNNVFATMESS